MKQLLALLLLVAVASAEAVCSPIYEPGQTLFVWAKSGLKLRAEPGLKSKVLSVLPDGAPVVVQRDSLPESSFSVQVEQPTTTYDGTKCPGLNLDGYWIRVKYKKQVGYVFDQYLSRLSTPTTGRPYTQEPPLVSVLKKKSSLVKLIEKTDTTSWGIYAQRTYLFADASTVQLGHPEDQGWWFQQTVITGCSLSEGYLIFDRLYQDDYQPAYHLLEKRPGYLRFEVEMGELEVYEIGGMLILLENHHC